MFTYQLIPAGVLILQDGTPYMKQDRRPGAQGIQTWTQDEAIAFADAFIADKEAEALAAQASVEM